MSDAKPETGDAPESGAPDVVFVQGRTEDGRALRAIRARPERIELTEIRPVQPGKPLSGEVVRLRPRQEMPLICDVEVIYNQAEEGQPGDAAHQGPPRVASERYRRNWEVVFGERGERPRLGDESVSGDGVLFVEEMIGGKTGSDLN